MYFRTVFAEIEACQHPTVMKEMCADCGADLRADDGPNRDVAVVPMVHSIPELKVLNFDYLKLKLRKVYKRFRDSNPMNDRSAVTICMYWKSVSDIFIVVLLDWNCCFTYLFIIS